VSRVVALVGEVGRSTHGSAEEEPKIVGVVGVIGISGKVTELWRMDADPRVEPKRAC
jgi:hypothetical protein